MRRRLWSWAPANGGATTRARVAAVGLPLAPLLAPFLLAASCDASSGLVDSGGECFLATDCAPGLVCVEQKNKTRVCSDDLTDVAGSAPPGSGGQDAAEGDAPAPKTDSGGGGQDSSSGGIVDAAPDISEPPPMDAGQER